MNHTTKSEVIMINNQTPRTKSIKFLITNFQFLIKCPIPKCQMSNSDH